MAARREDLHLSHLVEDVEKTGGRLRYRLSWMQRIQKTIRYARIEEARLIANIRQFRLNEVSSDMSSNKRDIEFKE